MGRGMKCCSIGKRGLQVRREWLSVGHASPNYRSELRFSECGGKEREKSPTELQNVIRNGADEVKGGATAKRRHAVDYP